MEMSGWVFFLAAVLAGWFYMKYLKYPGVLS